MIRLENVSYEIGNKNLLEDVSVTFEVGKMNLIVGPNGAGKSTLIKLISGLLRPTSGKVFIGAEEINCLSPQKISKSRAVLSQNIDLAFPLKVWEVVMMGRYPHFISKPTKQDEQACEEAMHFFDVLNLAERNYLTLSGGEKQRVHFARVLSQTWFPIENQPRILLLDEPLTFLDIQYQFQFMKQLQTLLKDQNLCVVGVLHDLNLAARFADTVLLLNQAKVLSHGTAKEVFTSQNIKMAFQLEATFHALKDSDRFFIDFSY
jgi:iron complex transport system ATP-binding protein